MEATHDETDVPFKNFEDKMCFTDTHKTVDDEVDGKIKNKCECIDFTVFKPRKYRYIYNTETFRQVLYFVTKSKHIWTPNRHKYKYNKSNLGVYQLFWKLQFDIN